MYKYSKGINLVTGGEKHRVYVKKSSNGKGAKGHVMVNHPTTDKGKWDTIDLTEKAGAKTVEQGKAATRKWHAENPYKMQGGNKKLKSKEPIYVSNPKDPRLKVYQDSLSLYNKTQDIGNPKYYTENSKPSWYNWKGDRNDVEKFMRKNNIDVDFEYYRTGKFPGKIQPIKTGDFGEGMAWPVYKKPEQPYIYKKPIVDTRDKTPIKPLTPKTPVLNTNITLPERNITPIKVENTPIKKGSGFARYPNLKNKIEKFNDRYLSGAKSVKQYRGDENLPEAKNGMKKNCGCKHTRSKYKYYTGTKGLTDPPPDKVYDNTYQSYEGPFKLDPYTYKEGNLSGTLNKFTRRSGKENYFFPEYSPNNLNWTKELARLDADGNPIKGTSLHADLNYPLHVQYHNNGKPNFIYKQENETDERALKRGGVETVGPMTKKQREKYIKDNWGKQPYFSEEEENKIVEDYIKRNNYKKEDLGYKYGTGSLQIPEGSAIVTANGGKNKQALKAYKQGNYKLLNKIIDDMPEDNVDKKQAGDKDLKARYIYLAGLTGPLSEGQKKELEEISSKLQETNYDLYDDKRIAEKFGQKYDVDKAKYRSSLRGGKLNLIEDKKNIAYRNKLRTDPTFFQQELKAGRVKIDDKGNISYTAVGKSAKGNQEFLGTSTKGTLPEIPTYPSTTLPASTLEQKKEEGQKKEETLIGNKRRGNFLQNIPSLAEIAARTSILGKGITYSNIPENYLKLDKYNYASQLPSTLREIQLAEQAGRDTARDMVAGDAGRYLAQAGNLSAARMAAANKAVIQDTLARQDILNKNVDLTNIETQTNRALKDQYAAMRNEDRLKARAAFDEQLISLGQSIDTAMDASRLMGSQRESDSQKLEMLKSMAQSGNYKVVTNPDGTVTYAPKAKGAKKLKSYKRK